MVTRKKGYIDRKILMLLIVLFILQKIPVALQQRVLLFEKSIRHHPECIHIRNGIVQQMIVAI
jgi:hypothetical protein